MLAALGVAGANRIGDAVGGQRITVPMQKTSIWPASEMAKSTISHAAQPTETTLPFADTTILHTQPAAPPFFSMRRALRQIEETTCSGVSLVGDRQRLLRLPTDAVQAHTQVGGDETRVSATQSAGLIGKRLGRTNPGDHAQP